jgi:HEAT repeat protein
MSESAPRPIEALERFVRDHQDAQRATTEGDERRRHLDERLVGAFSELVDFAPGVLAPNQFPPGEGFWRQLADAVVRFATLLAEADREYPRFRVLDRLRRAAQSGVPALETGATLLLCDTTDADKLAGIIQSVQRDNRRGVWLAWLPYVFDQLLNSHQPPGTLPLLPDATRDDWRKADLAFGCVLFSDETFRVLQECTDQAAAQIDAAMKAGGYCVSSRPPGRVRDMLRYYDPRALQWYTMSPRTLPLLQPPPLIEAITEPPQLRRELDEIWTAANALQMALDKWAAWFVELQEKGDAHPAVALTCGEVACRSIKVLLIHRPNAAPFDLSAEADLVAMLPPTPSWSVPDAQVDPQIANPEKATVRWQDDRAFLDSYYRHPECRRDRMAELRGAAARLIEMLKTFPMSAVKTATKPSHCQAEPSAPMRQGKKDSSGACDTLGATVDQMESADLAPLFTDALDRVVVVEDDSDARYILWWMKKILPAEQWEQLSSRQFFLYSGGRPTGDEVNQRLDTIRQIHPDERNLQPRAFVVADRDYRLDQEHAEEQHKLQGKDFSRQIWHVWQFVEIENYLILRDAMTRYILERLADAGPGSGREHVTEHDVRALIEEAIEASRPAVRTQVIDSFERCHPRWMASKTVTEAERFLDSKWRDDEKPSWCDAKEVVLPRIKEALKTRWNLTLSEREFIASLKPEEIPDDIRRTVEDIAQFLLGARWTRSSSAERAAIQPFFEALKSTAPDIRQKAAEALGTKGRVAVPALARALRDESTEVRMAAVESLRRIGRDAAWATDALAGALQDPDGGIQQRAAAALGGIGPGAAGAVPALIAAMRQGQWRLRCEAAAALGKIGVVDEAVPALIEAVRDRNVPARDVAAQALGEIGAGAVAAVGDLVTALTEDEVPVRAAAAVALGKIGTASPEVLEGFRNALRNEDASVRRAAAEGLGALGPAAAPAAVSLADLLEDRDETCRRAAAEALGKVRQLSRDEVVALVRTLCDGAWLVRQLAAQALGRIGRAAQEAAPELARLAGADENTVVRVAAAGALSLVGGDTQVALSVLIGALGGPNDAARKASAETLGELGRLAIPAVPALAAALTDWNWWVRFAAADTLGKLGPAAAAAVPALTAAFTDDYVEPPSAGRMSYGDGPIYDLIRYATALALGRIGGAAAPALPALRNARGYQKVVQDAIGEAIRLIEQGGLA